MATASRVGGKGGIIVMFAAIDLFQCRGTVYRTCSGFPTSACRIVKGC